MTICKNILAAMMAISFTAGCVMPHAFDPVAQGIAKGHLAILASECYSKTDGKHPSLDGYYDWHYDLHHYRDDCVIMYYAEPDLSASVQAGMSTHETLECGKRYASGELDKKVSAVQEWRGKKRVEFRACLAGE